MKTITDKLGFKPGKQAWMLDSPENMWKIIDLPVERPIGDIDLLLGFAIDVAALAGLADRMLPIYKRGGALWVAHPKKSGTIKSDLSRDAGWEGLTREGLIPVTQIALDDDWSALRFRYRDEVPKITRKQG
ncbi:hypothetical protein [Niveispirillum sp.]|uniref:hypothetical protein n=1 Tax=Niveispirillum sp. TaxID=1917217 RepID=UPI001B79F0DF|nr:hypothetical protein [Niveispirillum sp.]MBP7334999.1 hypothetical protein [Niveispirillum sp.]